MIRYPNGKQFSQFHKMSDRQTIQFSNRGMSLEEDINVTNRYYLDIGKAVIHKKPTPIQIVKVDYPKRSAAVITEAYFQQASTTDYNGVYRGKYIDFEAKETRNKTSFPLNNFHAHQVQHMKAVVKQGGICFVILKFTHIDTVFVLKAEHLFTFWDNHLNGGRKSIPLSFVKKHGEIVPYGYHPRIDYLSVIDKIYFD